MVARGDLGVETSPAVVPIIQKRIIDMANRHAKIVITATQMLDSMIHNPRPTRAEASDVANAIFDGSDAVMLSGETASGSYPLESVAMMDKIACEAEANILTYGHDNARPEDATQDDALALSQAARELAHDRGVRAIAVFTQTGNTALLMSKVRPDVPIFTFTPEVTIYRRLGLMWGVIPFLCFPQRPFNPAIRWWLSPASRSAPAGCLILPISILLENGFDARLHSSTPHRSG